MRRILITGGNKGIGLAIAARCVKDHDDVHVVLGCRSKERGKTAAKSLEAYADRVSVLQLDAASETSIKSAAAEFAKRHGARSSLYGLVNNAGIASGTPEEILTTNVAGPKRITDAFLPMLEPSGRVVMISSGAAPSCVEKSSEKRRAFFVDDKTQWSDIEACMAEALAVEKPEDADFGNAMGFYGVSKALLNCLTVQLARDHPTLKINACTPGMILTDIVRDFVPWYVPSFAVPFLARNLVGAKSPDEGTVAPLSLLFDALEGNGRFYGSDARRSPLDKYRSPGSEPYAGE